MSNITRKEKEDYIKMAVDQGLIQKKICPEAKGESLRRLLKDSSRVTEQKVNQMYLNAKKHLEGVPIVETELKNIPKKEKNSNNYNLLEIIQKQESRIKILEEQMEKIQNSIINHQVKNIATKPAENKSKIMRFSLKESMSVNSKNGKKYKYKIYCALRKINGKQVRIYIGKDISKATQKIKEYCEKNSIDINR